MSRPHTLRLDFTIVEGQQRETRQMATKPVDGDPTPWGAASVAVDAEGRRHVLIPVPGDMHLRSDKKSTGIHIGPHKLIDDGRERSFLDILCRRPQLNDVFVRIVEDVLEAITTMSDKPDRVASRTLDRWRALLARESTEAPSKETLVGVYAELLHLRDVCSLDVAGIDAWHGPDAAIHDFQRDNMHLEVKGTLVRQGWRCTIHGVNQLDVPTGGSLALSITRLELLNEGGTSVPDLVEELVASGVEAVGLYERLERAGLGVEQLEEAHRVGFNVIDRRIWGVGERFPRIVRASFVDGDLPTGVASISYQLDLTAYHVPPMTEMEVVALHTYLAQGKA